MVFDEPFYEKNHYLKQQEIQEQLDLQKKLDDIELEKQRELDRIKKQK